MQLRESALAKLDYETSSVVPERHEPVALISQTKQPSREALLMKKNDKLAEDAPWAEVAKFNQLLDMKIRLDEASEAKRKANMQREYLDQ